MSRPVLTRFHAAVAILSAALVLSFLPSAGAVQAQKPVAKGPAQPALDVQAIYKQQCQACHGPDGRGQLPGVASFPDGEWQHGSREQDIVKVIREGVPGTTMVGFKSRLKPEQIDALARYVRSFDKKLKPEPQTPVRK